ncbi:aromatic ring-hydroxylating dioxygenase subunit alpha [Iodidimonas sp. SYSU 1G8]|uniref:aromatic ring-hydroxylating oxygenase subunit alpha n=1 Tax=Iodidimonas sp. SYSU 1G8 TaxID=3133967 RepID=UPI0031FE612A
MDYNLDQGGPALNPEAPDSAADHKAAYVDNGTDTKDPSRYYSAAYKAREWERLWSRVWTIAGVASDIPETGDFLTYDLLHESFIIVRTGPGAADIAAYYNVCGHRGNRLVQADFGRVSGAFTCPFHSWQWTIDGALAHVTDAETFRPEVLAQAPDLVPVSLGIVAGVIFITMDENPRPLRDFLGPVADHMESFHVDKMNVVRHVRSEWAANWKTGIDAFYETYHLGSVHPQTQPIMGDINCQFDCYPNGMSRMIVPIGQPSPHFPDQETVNEGLQYMLNSVGLEPEAFKGGPRDVRPALASVKRDWSRQFGLEWEGLSDVQLTDSFATGIFPNVQFGMHPEGAFLMRFMPHPDDPQRFWYDTMTLVRHVDNPLFKVPDWMGLPEGTDCSGRERPDIERKATGEPPELGLVLDQDSELLPVVQKGLRSKAFKGPLWSEQEQRLRHFHNELDRYIEGEK